MITFLRTMKDNGQSRNLLVKKLVVFSSLTLTGIFLATGSAFAVPDEEFEVYLKNNRANKTIKLSNLSQLTSQANTLKFRSTSNAILNLRPYLESEGSALRTVEAMKAQGIVDRSQVSVEIMDFTDRLIVKQKLEYNGNAKACETRAQELSKAGIVCFNRNPSAKLSKGVNEKQIQDIVAEIKQKLKAESKSPFQGYSLAELQKMDDERLFGIALNSGPMTEESYLLVPKVEWKSLSALPLNNTRQPFKFPAASFTTNRKIIHVDNLQPIARLNTTRLAPIGRLPNPELSNPNIVADKFINRSKVETDKETKYLVNGFTWGQQYSWSKKLKKCISYVIGKKCVYAKPYASIGYGLGLRVPLQVDISTKRNVKIVNNQLVRFSPTIDITPINGGSDVYRSAGVRSDKVFNGKELIAEAAAKVGLKYDVLIDEGDYNQGVGVDITEYISSHGNFTPPDVNRSLSIGGAWSPDIAGGYFNFGVAGATFHAGAKFRVNGKKLEATAKIPKANGSQTIKSSHFPATYQPSTQDGRSSVSISDPVYSASWSAIPGFKTTVFLDVGVYRASKSFPLWLESYEIESANFNFATHEGSHDGYLVNATNRGITVDAM